MLETSKPCRCAKNEAYSGLRATKSRSWHFRTCSCVRLFVASITGIGGSGQREVKRCVRERGVRAYHIRRSGQVNIKSHPFMYPHAVWYHAVWYCSSLNGWGCRRGPDRTDDARWSQPTLPCNATLTTNLPTKHVDRTKHCLNVFFGAHFNEKIKNQEQHGVSQCTHCFGAHSTRK